MKILSRLGRIALLVALVFIFVSPTAVRSTRAASSPSLATLMPADTYSFTELDTSDLPGMLQKLQTSLATIGVQGNFLADLDQSLTMAFGRPASLEKDVFPWLGDRVGVGIYVPSSLIEGVFTRVPMAGGLLSIDGYFVAPVKDEAGADAFLAAVNAAAAKSHSGFTSKQSTIGSTAVTVYSDPQGNPVLARWKGYVALGTPSVQGLLDMLNGGKPTLADNANYKKIVGMLKPNSVAISYVATPSPSVLVGTLTLLGPAIGNVFQQIVQALETPGPNATATPSPTPTPTPSPESFEIAKTFVGLGASGIGLYGDQHTLATDWASYVDPDNLQQLLTLLKVPATVDLNAPAKTISLHMADQIPKDALAVAIGSNLAQIEKNGLVLGKTLAALTDVLSGTTASAASFDASYAQVLSTMQAGFGLDLNADVLSWLDGEFALYARVDATQLSFTAALLAQTSDTAKTDNFITKVNTGLQTFLQTAPAKNSSGLYTVALPSTDNVNYGRVKDIFVLSYGKDSGTVVNALNGDGVLSGDANWQAAAALAPPAFQHFWYLNVTAMNMLLKQATKNAPPGEYNTAEGLMSFARSAVLYSTDLGGGSSLTTVAFLLN